MNHKSPQKGIPADSAYPENGLAQLELCFGAQPAIVGMSGLVVADDVTGPGMDVGSSRALLASFREPHSDQPLIDLYNAYGANMAVPLAPIYAHSLRFDENLPLYGWLEDVDFSRQLAPYGCIVKNRRMVGVHLGVKIGRVSG